MHFDYLFWKQFFAQRVERDKLPSKNPCIDESLSHQHDFTDQLKVWHHHGTWSEGKKKRKENTSIASTVRSRNRIKLNHIFRELCIDLSMWGTRLAHFKQSLDMSMTVYMKYSPRRHAAATPLLAMPPAAVWLTWKEPSGSQVARSDRRNQDSSWWRCPQLGKGLCLGPWN